MVQKLRCTLAAGLLAGMAAPLAAQDQPEREPGKPQTQPSTPMSESKAPKPAMQPGMQPGDRGTGDKTLLRRAESPKVSGDELSRAVQGWDRKNIEALKKLTD